MKNVMIFSVIILLLSCAGKVSYENIEIGDNSNEKKVLIAVQVSEFKNQLLDAVVTELRTNIYLNIIDIEDLPDSSAVDFDVVVIITEKRVFNINKNAREFIENTAEKDKIVLFFTEAGKSRMPEEFIGIDAVSSASRYENLESMKEFIITELEKRL